MATKKLTALDVRNTPSDFDWLMNFIVNEISLEKAHGYPYYVLPIRYDREDIINELKIRKFKVKENPEGRKCVIW